MEKSLIKYIERGERTVQSKKHSDIVWEGRKVWKQMYFTIEVMSIKIWKSAVKNTILMFNLCILIGFGIKIVIMMRQLIIFRKITKKRQFIWEDGSVYESINSFCRMKSISVSSVRDKARKKGISLQEATKYYIERIIKFAK